MVASPTGGGYCRCPVPGGLQPYHHQMDIDDLIRTKRSIRSFTTDPLEDEDLRAILEAGRRAQSSKNSQPWTFIVVRDREVLRQLSELGRYAGHLAGAAVGIALVASEPADFDLGQAAANMQLAAHARGVGSCIASMWESDRAKAILGVPAELHFDTMISFGWPVPEELDRPPRKGGRRPLDEVVRWERWANPPTSGSEPGPGTP
jgi:nitroreductase